MNRRDFVLGGLSLLASSVALASATPDMVVIRKSQNAGKTEMVPENPPYGTSPDEHADVMRYGISELQLRDWRRARRMMNAQAVPRRNRWVGLTKQVP